MEELKKAAAVISGFIKKGNKYLVVYDPRFNDKGFWRVPGGRPEDDEKVEDTLKREIKEELGLDIKIKRFLGFGQDYVLIRRKGYNRSRVILYFECEVLAGEPKIDNYEATELKWVTLDEMKKIKPLEPALHDFFKRFKIK